MRSFWWDLSTPDNTGDAPGLEHVRVIVGVRSGTGVETRPELAHGHRIELTPPAPEDLRQALPLGSRPLLEQHPSGGWLIVRLIRETPGLIPHRPRGIWTHSSTPGSAPR